MDFRKRCGLFYLRGQRSCNLLKGNSLQTNFSPFGVRGQNDQRFFEEMDCRSKEVTGDVPAAWDAAGDLATGDFLGETQNSKTPQRATAQRAMVRFKQRSEASPFSSNLNFRADFPAVPDEFFLIPYKMDIPLISSTPFPGCWEQKESPRPVDPADFRTAGGVVIKRREPDPSERPAGGLGKVSRPARGRPTPVFGPAQ
jgi:hypothetical protein